MASDAARTLTYEFGAFRLDPAERLPVRNGRAVPLTPKAFDLLVHLVDHRGRLVEKHALMTALWPDTIVEEANLAYNVSALRKVLDERIDGDSMIQTVPTKGYRFVGAVTLASRPRSDPEPREPAPADPGSVAQPAVALPARRKTAVAVAAVALLGVAGCCCGASGRTLAHTPQRLRPNPS